jgi:enoyl-[acyl-carrier-protein] reductase (NADH)
VPDVLELDVNKPEDIEAVAEDLRERWGRVDGILHAIAFAPEDALGRQLPQHAGRERDHRVPDLGLLV